MVKKMLRNLIKSFAVLLLFFTSADLENVNNQTPTSTVQPLIPFADNTSCGSYNVQNINNNSSEETGDCSFPDLFSTETGKCQPFTEVDCGNRSEPITPCEYPKSNCTRPKGENVSLCTCEEYPDLNYDTCVSLKDGEHVWPARHWSPFYIQCTSQRTVPSSCSGHSVIYNFFQNKCQLVYEVVNAAYNLSLSLSIPKSLYHLISYRPTQFMHETTQPISMTNFKPTPTTNIEIQTTPAVFGTFTDIRSTLEVASPAIYYGETSKIISVLSRTTPPLSDLKVSSTVMTHIDSSVYNLELSTELLISSSGGASDILLKPSSAITVSPNVVSELPFESMTKFVTTEALPLSNITETVSKIYTSTTSFTSVAKENIPHSSGSIESKKEQTNIAPTPSSSFSTLVNTKENIVHSDSLQPVHTVSGFSLLSTHVSLQSSFLNSPQTYSAVYSSSEVYPLTSNTIAEVLSEIQSLKSLNPVNSVGILSGYSSLSSVLATVSSLPSTSFLSQPVSSASSSSLQSTETSTLLSYSSIPFSLTSFNFFPYTSFPLKTDETPSAIIFPSSSTSSSSMFSSLSPFKTEHSFSSSQSLSLTSLPSGQIVYSSSVEYKSQQVLINDSLSSLNPSSDLQNAFTPLSTLVEKDNSLYSASSLSLFTTAEQTYFFNGRATSSSSPPPPPSLSLSSSSLLLSVSHSLPSSSVPSSSSSSSPLFISTPPTAFQSTSIHRLSPTPITPLMSSLYSLSSKDLPSINPSVVPALSLHISLQGSVMPSRFSSSLIQPLPIFEARESKLLKQNFSANVFESDSSLGLTSTDLFMSNLFTNGRATSTPISTTSHLAMSELSTNSKFILKPSSAASQINLSDPSAEVLTLSKSLSTTSQTISHLSMTESNIEQIPNTLSATPILPSNIQTEYNIASSTSNDLLIETSIKFALNTEALSKQASASIQPSLARVDSSSILKQTTHFASGSSSILKSSTTYTGGSDDVLKPSKTFTSGSSSRSILKPSKAFTSASSVILNPSQTLTSEPSINFPRGSSSILKPSKTFTGESSGLLKPSITFASGHSSTAPRRTTPTTSKAGGNSDELQKNKETSIAIGVGVGGGIVLICLILLVVIIALRKKKKRGRRDFFQVRLPPELFMRGSL